MDIMEFLFKKDISIDKTDHLLFSFRETQPVNIKRKPKRKRNF